MTTKARLGRTCWPCQNITLIWPLIAFYCVWYLPQNYHHCTLDNSAVRELNRKIWNVLPCMQISDFKTFVTLLDLVFLKLDTHHCPLDLKLLEENSMQLSQGHCISKHYIKTRSIYNNDASKIYPGTNSTASSQDLNPQKYWPIKKEELMLFLKRCCWKKTVSLKN